MRSTSSGTHTAGGTRAGRLSAAERSALNQTLAKALAFRDAGKMEEAREWAAELVGCCKHTISWRDASGPTGMPLGRRSLLRHAGLAQPGEVGGFVEGADLRHPMPCARRGFQAGHS